MNGVWNAPETGQGDDLLGAERLGVFAGGGDAVGRTGDDDLPGCVVVGDPHVGVRPPAGHVDLFVVEAEHGGHRAGMLGAGVVHRVGAGDDEPHSVVESECARRRQRGVLPEAVAGAVARLDAESLGRVEDHQAGDERGQLGVACVAQLLGVGIEEQFADIAFGDLTRLTDELPALVVEPRSPHPRTLRPLPRERECEHRPDSRRPSGGVPPATHR